ncbi:MAG: type III-A CRISPR-associated RAMP protein Csm4 [Dictyoglomaceae bacterium]
MKVEVYKLFKKDPILLHIGIRRMDRTSTIIHSDTLFSALCNSLIKLFGEESFEIFEKYLLISSMFIGLRGTKKDLLFLPVPEIPISLPKKEDLYNKKYKRIQWISWEVLNKFIKYFNKEENNIILENVDEFKFLNSKFLITKEEFEEIKEEIIFMDTVLEPKVCIDRDTNEPNLYFQENLLIYSPKTSSNLVLNPFLYFLKIPNDKLETLFISTLNLFIEDGIGGERSTGKGSFDYYEKNEIELSDNGNYEITLSLTIPKKEEISNLIYYQIVKRDGFIYFEKPIGLKKKTHYKIKEGALVKSPYIGENIDASPLRDFKVISYGKNLGYKFFG